MTRMKKTLIATLAAALLGACATQQTQKKETPVEPAKTADTAPAAPAADVAEASLRGGTEFEAHDGIKPVYFGYDSSQLSDETLAALKNNAEVLKADATLMVLIAGNCDERGTVAYNLALGQKRAKEVRDYYMRLGVDGSRVATISYGKEKPICHDQNDACWTTERRADTLTRAKL